MIPLDHLRLCRDMVATVIALGRPEAVPIFERIEAEIARAEAASSAVERARAIAATSRFKAAAAKARREPVSASA